MHVLDTLFDEYDPIRSLDAFGMHVIEDNPGVREALAAKEHSVAIRIRRDDGGVDGSGSAATANASAGRASSNDAPTTAHDAGTDAGGDTIASSTGDETSGNETSNWYYGPNEQRKPSKTAWWRNLGMNRKRDTEEN